MWLLYFSLHILFSFFFFGSVYVVVLLMLLLSCFCVFTFLSVHDSNGLNLVIAMRKLGSKHR